MVSDSPIAHRLILDGELTVRGAEALHARLLNAINTRPAVTVDCSAVTLVDVCALQLLMAAHRTARQCGNRFVLAGPPEGVVRDALLRGGFLTDGGAPDRCDAALWSTGGNAA